MRSTKKRIAATMMSFVCLCAVLFSVPQLTINTQAAMPLTSIGLAEYGLKAYNDNWQYVYGNAGQTLSSGLRSSDCSGLVYAYFTDNGTTGPRGVTSQVKASVQSGPIATIPRIHGLIITISNYDHLGIYLGNNTAVDNSDVGVNMKYGPVIGYRGWLQWHMLDANIKYPTNGFYAYNGNMYYYQDRQYVINTTFSFGGTTYTVGSDGIVKNTGGKAIPVNTAMWNEGYAAAKPIAGIGSAPDGVLGTVNTSAVNVRSTASISGSKVTMLYSGYAFYVQKTVDGDNVKDGTSTSSRWYYGTTATGESGYVNSMYITLGENAALPPAAVSVSAPAISCSGGKITMSSSTSGAAIYYTTDGTDPTTASLKYSDAFSLSGNTTFKACAVLESGTSSVTKLTVLTNGETFKDIDPTHWFWKLGYFEEAVLGGLFSGNGDGTFSPTKSITRAEFVTALAKMGGYSNDTIKTFGTPSYADAKSGWYANYVAWAEKTGYVNGYSDGTFRPNNEISREEMCTVLARFGNLSSSGSSTQFSDHSKISSWAKDAVYACKELGIVSGNSSTASAAFSPKNSTQRCEAAKVLVVYNKIN